MKLMRSISAVFVLLGASVLYGQQYGRMDFSLQNAQGQAISGAQVNVYTQSACGAAAGALATLYPTASGGTPLTQPLITDGFGHQSAYALPGCVTITYNSPYTGVLTYKDQSVFAGNASGSYISSVLATPQTMAGPLNGPSAGFSNYVTAGISVSALNLPLSVTAPPYFAAADNSTDDTAALQAAINAASLTGQDVYVPPAAAGHCYKFTHLYFFYNALLNPGYASNGGYSFRFYGGRTSWDNDGNNVGNSTATTCLTSTDSIGPAFQFGGGPEFAGNTGTLSITNTSMATGTATYDWTLLSGAKPVTGQVVYVRGTTNGSGQFNLQGGTVGTVTGTTGGTFTVTAIIPAASYSSQAETGTAFVGTYNYGYEGDSIENLTLNVTNSTWAIAADLVTSHSYLKNLTVYQYGTGNGVMMEDVWSEVHLDDIRYYSEYGLTYALTHSGYPVGTAGVKVCNNLYAGLMQIDKVEAFGSDHGFELGSVNSVSNCSSIPTAFHGTNLDGSSNNTGFWLSGVGGSIDHSYVEGSYIAGVQIGPYSNGPFKFTDSYFYNPWATLADIYVSQTSLPSYIVKSLDISNNIFFASNVCGIALSDSTGASSGKLTHNSFTTVTPTSYGICLPATTVKWNLDANAFQMNGGPSYNTQNPTSATMTYDGVSLMANIKTTSLSLGGGTPISSSSSPTTQAVTCQPGGVGAQLCAANGLWGSIPLPAGNGVPVITTPLSAYVNSVGYYSSAASTFTIPSTTAGNGIFIITTFPINAITSVVVGSQVATKASTCTAGPTGNLGACLWYIPSAAGGQTLVTVTPNTAGLYEYEVSGINPSNPLEVQAQSAGLSVSTGQLLQPNELIISAFVCTTSPSTITGTNATFTNPYNFSPSYPVISAIAVTSSSTNSVTATVDSGCGTALGAAWSFKSVQQYYGTTQTGTANSATCWKTTGTLGSCSTVVAVDGTCTCN